jgi:hypothetical protein
MLHAWLGAVFGGVGVVSCRVVSCRVVSNVLRSCVQEADGASPLFMASQNGHVKVVRALLAAGAAPNQAMVRLEFIEGVAAAWNVCACVCLLAAM